MKRAKFYKTKYSEVPNRRADLNKRAGLRKNSTLPAFLLSKLINEQGGIFCLLSTRKIESMEGKKSEKSKRACSSILGTSEYLKKVT